MRLKLFIASLLLLVALPAHAWMGPVIAGGGVAAKSCAVDSALWIDEIHNDDFYSAGGHIDNYTFCGQGDFSPGGDKVICQVNIAVRNVSGTPEMQVRIYEMSGTSLGTLNAGCTSASQVISSAGTKSFTDLDCSLDSAKTYGIVIVRSDGTYSDTDYLGSGVWVGTAGNMNISGLQNHWFSNKTANGANSADMSMQIYGYTP